MEGIHIDTKMFLSTVSNTNLFEFLFPFFSGLGFLYPILFLILGIFALTKGNKEKSLFILSFFLFLVITLSIPKVHWIYEKGGIFFSFLSPYAIMVGLTTVSLFMTQGAIFLLLKTEGRLHARLTFLLKKGMIFFITSFAATSLYTLVFLPGVADKFKEYPIFFIIPVLAFLAVANVPRLVSKKKYANALVFSSLTMSFLLMLVAFQLYPVLLPSTISPEYNITIYNAASSQKSLGIMLTIVLIGAPLLAGYFLFLYKTFHGKVKLDDTSY